MSEPPFSPHARDRHLQARKTLEEATLPVQTDSLSQRGIRKLRVLSESKFAQLVGQLVESGKLSLPTDPRSAQRAQDAWGRIRRHYRRRVEHIEAVAARLSEGLLELDRLLEDMATRNAPPRRRDGAMEPHETRRAILLREMLHEECA